jgi:dimethylargininase
VRISGELRRRTVAVTHVPSPRLPEGERTYVDSAAISYERALKQHARYREALRDCGVTVQLLDVNRELPDSVFVEDTAIVLDEVAVMMPMGVESRRGEPPAIEQALRRYRSIERIELPATIEGGDITRVGRTLFVGRSSRTNAAGIEALRVIAARFGYDTIGVRLRDCLHLKTACTALPDDRLLINPSWVDVDDLRGFSVIGVPKDEPWAADILSIGQTVCMAASFPRTAELVSTLGFDVRPIDLSEFAKAEGGVTCLSLVFEALVPA